MKFSHSRLRTIFAVALFALTTNIASAQNPWLVRLGIESGGDELIRVPFDDGTTRELDGGGLIHFEAGKQFSFFASNDAHLTEVSVGYKFDSVNANNGDLKFSRTTISAMQFYRFNEKFKLGVGLTYHVNPTLDVDAPSDANSFKREVDDALGVMFAADYLVSELFGIGLRATQIDYDSDEVVERSGNSVGIFLTRYF